MLKPGFLTLYFGYLSEMYL